MNILFRADSSSTIGTGHIMRDLVLAQQYAKKGNHIIFATQDLTGNINHKIIEANYQLKILKSNNINELDKLIKKLKIDIIVIDHYDINYNFEKKLKKNNAHLQILSFDDTYEKHHCDILLNHNISADKKRYRRLVPKNCELRCGAKYTLLRDEFLQEMKKSKIQHTTIKTIFIAMGGADTANLNINILRVLKKIKKNSNIKVNLVTTTSNKNLETLKKYCKDKSWIKLHINSNKIAKLMKESALAIVTPSVTVNEVYFMKLPLIAIKTADNQKEIYEYLKQKKLDVLKRFDKQNLLNKLHKYLKEN